jgi:hypothetical protein
VTPVWLALAHSLALELLEQVLWQPKKAGTMPTMLSRPHILIGRTRWDHRPAHKRVLHRLTPSTKMPKSLKGSTLWRHTSQENFQLKAAKIRMFQENSQQIEARKKSTA